MRPRVEIEADHRSYEQLNLEVLLDIRELLQKAKGEKKPYTGKPRGRPKVRENG